MVLTNDKKKSDNLSSPEVFISSSGSYHVKVKDILNSQKGQVLIKKMAELNLVKNTKDK